MATEKKKKIIKKNQGNEKDNERKQKLGQFYTTNFEYILNGMNIPDGITHIIEPLQVMVIY